MRRRGQIDPGPVLRDWMGDVAPTRAPERLLGDAFARTMGSKQLRRYPWHGPAWRSPVRDGRRSRFALAGVATVAVVIGVVLLRPGPGPRSVGVPPPSATPSQTATPTPSPTASPTPSASPTLPATSITPLAVVPLSGGIGMATDGASVWSFTEQGRLVRIDPTTNTVAASVALESPTHAYQGIAVGDTGVWVTDWDAGVVERYDPTTLKFADRIDVGFAPKGVLATADAVWVADTHGGTVSHVDPVTNKVVTAISVGRVGPSGPNWLASGFGSIWTDVPNESTVVRIDPSTDTVQTKIQLPPSAMPCGGIGIGTQAVWVTSCDGGTFATRIDPATDTATGAVELGGHGPTFATVEGALWIAPSGDRLVRIDQTSNAVDKAISPAVGFAGGGDIVVASGSVWLMDTGNGQVLRLAPSDLGD